MTEEQESKVAYVRISKELKEFIELCDDKYKIVGFDWRKDDPFNLGLVLEDKQ